MDADVCLAENLYYEAANQSLPGILAVGHVVLNRAKKARLSVCAVVHAPSQFSWTLKPHGRPDQVLWGAMLDIARGLIRNPGKDPTHGATYYHATYVTPSWAKKFRRTTKIGDHIFYAADHIAVPARSEPSKPLPASAGKGASRAERDGPSWPPIILK